MTLHEAIEKLLRQVGRPMTTKEIADELNKNGWYQKKEGSLITPFQIHGRTKNYPNLFMRNGSTVSLRGHMIPESSTSENKEEEVRIQLISEQKSITIEKELMNEKSFKSAAIIDDIVPDVRGLYCIRISDTKALPAPFDRIIEERMHNIIYIGIATKSLKERFLNKELRAKGYGTFFRSIGAVLGYRPPKGSLKDKANKKNYKFSRSDKMNIIEWINNNLVVNWIEFNGNLEEIETKLIQKYLPLLNIDKNPIKLKELADLRALCVKIANN